MPIRLMASLLYLKHSFNLSDEDVCERWSESALWQFFSGMDYYEHRKPCDATQFGRFRNDLGEDGMEQLLKATIDAAVAMKTLKFKSLSPQQKGWLRRRQAVEPAIGHLKSDHRMDRCWLKGALGDALHTISCAAGYNLRWLLRAIARLGIAPAPLCLLQMVLSAATALRCLPAVHGHTRAVACAC